MEDHWWKYKGPMKWKCDKCGETTTDPTKTFTNCEPKKGRK